jgi:hypothetical protein
MNVLRSNLRNRISREKSKAGKKIKAGDRVQVRNPDLSLSEELTFTGLEQRRQ